MVMAAAELHLTASAAVAAVAVYAVQAVLVAPAAVTASAVFLPFWSDRLVSTIYSTLADRTHHLLHLSLLLPRVASFLRKAPTPLENGRLPDEDLLRKLPTLSDQFLDGGNFLDNRNRRSRKLAGPWDPYEVVVSL